MTAATTYTTLLQDLRRYLERGFSESTDPYVYEQLPRLITLGERRIARELKILGFVRAVETTLDIGNPVLEKPDRWRDTISMNMSGKFLLGRSFEYCKNYWPDPASTDIPEYYADYDYSRWLIVPTPVASVDLQILYYEQPRFLDEEFQTNWLTEYAPDLLLYASLLEATPYLKNDERLPVWQQMYDRAAQALSGEDMKRIMDRAANRTEV